MEYKIIYDEEQLRSIKAESVETLKEGQEIAMELFKVLATQQTSPALSAAQVGLSKRVVVMNIREPLYFVNPEIIDCDKITPYPESSVNYPSKICFTARYARVLVKADNLKNPVWLGLPEDSVLNKTTVMHPVVMEAVYLQQTIESLNGMTMWDFEVSKNEPTKMEKIKKVYRNELVTIIKDDQELQIKYKRIEQYLEDGWILKENKNDEEK